MHACMYAFDLAWKVLFWARVALNQIGQDSGAYESVGEHCWPDSYGLNKTVIFLRLTLETMSQMSPESPR